ncbi:MAG: Zn-ribbon domain-containing OB-fold protein [Actinomyces sp.]|nr:MAG: Zn-ribbon domain-containing OB-fold protein [Actinomyces sp.]
MTTSPLPPPRALARPVRLPDGLADVEPVRSVRTPIRIEYTYTPGRSLSAYLRAMADKRILGDRCPVTGQVFVPPRGVSPVAGVPTEGFVELPGHGYVESFNITRVPIPGRDDLHPPYVSAWIVLDGASVGFLGLVAECEPEEVRIGMQVEAVWLPDEELTMSARNIRWWRPTGEPDVVVTDYARVGRVDDPAAGGGGS